MDKSAHFFGQSVPGRPISLIDDNTISRNSQKHKAGRYIKKLTTRDHLRSMLFCVFAKCSSLREVSGAMIGLSGKTKHFQLNNLPYPGTLSDANRRKTSEVFSGIYHSLLKKYSNVIPDSRVKQVINKQVEIFDSTTISIFQDILKCTGRSPKDGKRKGGIKMRTVINVDESVPKMVWFTSGATNDHILLDKLFLNKDTIYVFDKGYKDYKVFKRLSDHQTGFVARIKVNAVYKVAQELLIEECIHSGVLEDKIIELEVKEDSQVSKLKLKKITFYDRVLKRKSEFLTNLFEMRPDLVAAIYKLRWQIDPIAIGLLFKQLKQNFPLKYFPGDNENAVKIQIYCALIVNLLLTVIKNQLKRKWLFSNLVSFCRIHLFNYLHLMHFLEDPEKDWRKPKIPLKQYKLF